LLDREQPGRPPRFSNPDAMHPSSDPLEEAESQAKHAKKALTFLPLVALIFFDVSGGPFGTEVRRRRPGGAQACSGMPQRGGPTSPRPRCAAAWVQASAPPTTQPAAPARRRRLRPPAAPPPAQDAVRAGGPLLVLLGFIVLPLVWSVPEALITAELATAFPENSGYVAWV
jgi:hypothetical protein